MSAPGHENDPALLVSAHYDTSLGSPGASDDAASIAIMMEMVNNLAQSPPPFPVVFNFNGAEESILPASHGFISGHPWKKNIRCKPEKP